LVRALCIIESSSLKAAVLNGYYEKIKYAMSSQGEAITSPCEGEAR